MPISLAVKIITKALCIVIDVIVLFLNPLIIDVIHNDRTIKQQPSAVFITNLAIADMFVAGTNLMNMILHFMDLSHVVPVCIVLYGFFSLGMINASLLFMFCNSIDRFVFIKMSFHYHAMMSRSCVRGLVIAVWIVSVSTPFFPYIFIDHAWEFSTCIELFHSQVYRVFHFILAVIFVLTLMATAIMFISVFHVVRRSRRLRQLPVRTFSSDTTISSGSTGLFLTSLLDSPNSSVTSELVPYRHEQSDGLLQSGSNDETLSQRRTTETADECSAESRDEDDIALQCTSDERIAPKFSFSLTNSPNDVLNHNPAEHNKARCATRENVDERTLTSTPGSGLRRNKRECSFKIESSSCRKVKKLHKQDSFDASQLPGGEKDDKGRIGKSTVRETKSETLPKTKRHRRSCARKAVDRTNQLTHIWCTEPTTTNVSYNPDLMPDSIFIFRKRSLPEIDYKNQSSSSSRAQHEVPRINCLQFDGKYSIVIESSSLVSEINRSIAACYDESRVNGQSMKPVLLDEAIQEPQFSNDLQGDTTRNSESVSESDGVKSPDASSIKPSPLTRPKSISLETRPRETAEQTASRSESSQRPPRFSLTGLGLRKKLSSQSTSTTPSTPYGITTYSGKDIRTLKILFLMFCVYLFLWFPTFLVNVLRSLNIEVSLEVVVICYTFGVSNSVVNFFVYPMKIPRLKLVFKQILQKSFNGAKKTMKEKLAKLCPKRLRKL